ncbi:DUF5667 domain-containing protein [Nonomuraea sp. NPDC059023]|uniref:DUF5667 domain-containing protein n=1 Tax=unclassified Nonomuraea TaxID=2593643 RepID=UPI00367CDC12
MGRARPSRWPFGATQGSHERLLGHLDELRSLPQGGGPDGDFRERLRTRLISADADADAAAPAVPEAKAPPGRARHARRTRRVRLSWPSQLATLGLAAGMMVSAFFTYQSVPGDTLYPLKRAAEHTLVRLSTDDRERAEREMVSAKERAAEVAVLLGGSGDGPLVSATLSDMAESTKSAIKRMERVEPRSPKLNSFAQDQRDMVEPMLEQLNGPEQDQASTYLHYIEGLAVPR